MAFCQQKSCGFTKMCWFYIEQNPKNVGAPCNGGNDKTKLQRNKEVKSYKTHYKMNQEKWNTRDRSKKLEKIASSLFPRTRN